MKTYSAHIYFEKKIWSEIVFEAESYAHAVHSTQEHVRRELLRCNIPADKWSLYSVEGPIIYVSGNGSHTPAPWQNDNSRKYYDAWLIRHNGIAIARMMQDTTRPKEEHEANARLIAAAPELLEAAKMAEDMLCWFRQMAIEGQITISQYAFEKKPHSDWHSARGLEKAIAKAVQS